MRKLIPGGRLSHWRGDADTLWGNVLIPDTIRQESDSDYGGMVSIGNSEIRERRITSRPSVFRAICFNGCIWDREAGQARRTSTTRFLFGQPKPTPKEYPLLDG